MLQVLFDHFNRTLPFPEEEFNTLCQVVKPVVLKKNTHVYTQGRKCSFGAFIVKGCLRLYTLNANGDDFTVGFSFEDYWIGDVNSILYGHPTSHNLVTLEDTTLLKIDRKSFPFLFENCPTWVKFHQLKREKHISMLINRIVKSNTEKAEEKYLELLERQPQIFNRVPQYYIASYLGIKPQSLSRLRRNLSEKAFF
jgi:CRP/FNR family transcriptional regulator, anaerobic regulatory protein